MGGRMVRIVVVFGLCTAWHLSAVASVVAAGRIKGSTGGHERSASVYARDGRLLAWTITGIGGLYEFGGLEPGEYMMEVAGALVPYVRVEDGRTTIVDQASQPKLSLEQELWTPSRVRFAQSFVATGTGVEGFSVWRASGSGKLLVSLYEDSPAGKRIAGPYETAKEMNWICWSDLPADEFRTVPSKTYALELAAANGKPWNHSVPRVGDVYPDGIAYYDGVPHSESDLGIGINEARPGLRQIAGAGEDLHFIKEGLGSGSCEVAGQTFVATAPNVIRAGANCGWGGGVEDFIFSIHEDGPAGKQIGPAGHGRMVSDWGTDAIWFPDAIQLTPGKRYYLQYRRADGESFYSYLSKNVYEGGRAFRDGKMLPERFDQLFRVIGEAETDGVIYPYDVRASDVTDTSATITWRTGTPGDGLVHCGTTMHLNERAGSEQTRAKEHEIVLTGLQPGTVYMYRVSSDTHKESSRRTYSRIYSFLTQPGGADRPKFDRPEPVAAPAPCDDCIEIVNPGFEDGTEGWLRKASSGRAKEPETFVPDAEPFGKALADMDGYKPHSGNRMYGWSYFGPEDPTWKEPREDWKRELIYQRIGVEAGKEYVLTAWLLTGDRGSGWGRDTRIRLAVDQEDAGVLESFDTIDQANATQWFATHHRWLPISLRFRAKSDHVTIGVNFLQWWALQTNRLYVDEISVRPVDSGDN